MKKSILLLLFFSTVFLCHAQWYDSTETGFFTLDDATMNELKSELSVDSYLGMLDFRTDTFGVISLGNQGDVRRSLLFRHLQEVRPNIGVDGYFKNMTSTQFVPMYNVHVPLGGIRLMSGYDSGQMFGLFLTLNTHSRFNVYLDFQRNNSRGLFFNQQNKADQFLFSSTFSSEDERYDLAILTSLNWSDNIEWGGIANDSSFRAREFDIVELYSVKLNQSTSKAFKGDVALLQRYKLFGADSTNSLGVFYDLNYLNQRFEFSTADPNLLSIAAIDAELATDSIHFTRTENFAGIFFSGEKKTFDIKAGIHHTYYNYSNRYFGLAENLIGLGGSIVGSIKQMQVEALFRNYLNGAFAGAYDLRSKVHFEFTEHKIFVTGFFNQGLYNPGMFYNRNLGNFFVWDNNFRKIFINHIGGTLGKGHHSITTGIYLMDAFVYFDEMALPAQMDGFSSVFYTDVKSNIKLYGRFKLDSRVRFQTTNQSDFIRLPSWVFREIVYYQRSFFESKLDAQIGIDFQYFSSFMSEGFMPLTSVMFLQNDELIGNFPYATLFAAIKIRDFNLFLRLENITDQLLPRQYFAAPGYPLPPFNFRFGAKWNFFN